ncbi:MAG: hypothetical protein IKH28_01265 [Lachnospiraceae bacterium]|nr:hypothetical protein [Lachnospiraceae bacterium]
MKRGNGKKRVLKEIAVSIILSMALCGCDFSAGEPTEQNPTETVTESSTPEVDKNSADLRKEELPFEGMESMTCQEYDEDNILGLSAIYVGDHNYVCCFVRNAIWKDFEERFGDISVYAADGQDHVITISGYEIEESKNFFWVQIYAEDKDKVKGVSIANIYYGYSVLGLENPKLTIMDLMDNKLKVQLFEDGQWGETIDYDMSPIHQPD